jgi:hypothetical protein
MGVHVTIFIVGSFLHGVTEEHHQKFQTDNWKLVCILSGHLVNIRAESYHDILDLTMYVWGGP